MPSADYPLAEVDRQAPARKSSQPTPAASAFVAGAQPTLDATVSQTSSAESDFRHENASDLDLLEEELHPSDSYYKGTYWADLPRAGASSSSS